MKSYADATLLYGANAIGGLVNTITDQIPTAPVVRPTGEFIFDLGSNAGEAGGAGDVHFGNGRFAMHVAGGGRRNGDFSTPRARLRTRSRGAVCSTLAGRGRESNVTLAQATGSTARSMAFRLSKRLISLNPERHAFTIRAGGTGLEGAIPSYRATLGIRRYQHDELVGDEVGTHFDNDTEDAELMLSHRPFRRLSSTVGGSFLNRAFNAIGEEALSPPIDQRGGALFLYEELTWPHVTLQFGGRVDRTTFNPDSDTLPDRDFTEVSNRSGSCCVRLPPKMTS